MTASFTCFTVEQIGDVYVAQIREGGLDWHKVQVLGRELSALIDQGCRKLILRFGVTECLYSALMGQLLLVRRRLQECKGSLKLCEVPPLTRDVFRVCKLQDFFEFVPDLQGALREW